MSAWLAAGLATLAFLAGSALERYRVARRETLLTLRETPGRWYAGISRTVGVGYAAAAALLVGAAVAITVAVPGSLERGRDTHAPAARKAAAPSDLPSVRVRRVRLGDTARVGNVRFRVMVPDAPWADALRRRRAAGGSRWVPLAVSLVNAGGRPLRPAELGFRLRAGSRAYAPDAFTGTGRALASRGYLEAGERSEAQLGFILPRRRGRATLVFQPSAASDELVEVGGIPTSVVG